MNRPEDQHLPRRLGRSRVYHSSSATESNDLQGDGMRTTPLGDARSQPDDNVKLVQSGEHGEGAATYGNSLRGGVSGGLSGATTTRGGQQGGIGASAFDADPGANSADADDSSGGREQDLTVGEQYGGSMETPGGRPPYPDPPG